MCVGRELASFRVIKTFLLSSCFSLLCLSLPFLVVSEDVLMKRRMKTDKLVSEIKLEIFSQLSGVYQAEEECRSRKLFFQILMYMGWLRTIALPF